MLMYKANKKLPVAQGRIVTMGEDDFHRRHRKSDDGAELIIFGLAALTVGLIFGVGLSDGGFDAGVEAGYGVGHDFGYAGGFEAGADTVTNYGSEAAKSVAVIANSALHNDAGKSVQGAVMGAISDVAKAALPAAIESGKALKAVA